MVLEQIRQGFVVGYDQLLGLIPDKFSPLFNLFVFSLLISIYAIFTWNFYRNLSKKDLLKLDLARYNRSDHPVFYKLFATILYILEYIVILPVLIFFWFAFMSLIIIAMSEGQQTQHIVTITAAVVAAIRIIAYYNEELSRDVAKLFPLTVLSIFLLSPGFFAIDKILSFLTELPSFFSSLVYFFIFIIAIELVLRMVDLTASLLKDDLDEKLKERGISVPKAN